MTKFLNNLGNSYVLPIILLSGPHHTSFLERRKRLCGLVTVLVLTFSTEQRLANILLGEEVLSATGNLLRRHLLMNIYAEQ